MPKIFEIKFGAIKIDERDEMKKIFISTEYDEIFWPILL